MRLHLATAVSLLCLAIFLLVTVVRPVLAWVEHLQALQP